MSALVSFWWERAHAVLEEGQGTTRDISWQGVFVVATFFPPVRMRLEIEVYLAAARGPPRVVQLHGEGKVVRASREGSESGFAAEVVFRESSGGSFVGTGDVIQ